jgi:hypothetical protein
MLPSCFAYTAKKASIGPGIEDVSFLIDLTRDAAVVLALTPAHRLKASAHADVMKWETTGVLVGVEPRGG